MTQPFFGGSLFQSPLLLLEFVQLCPLQQKMVSENYKSVSKNYGCYKNVSIIMMLCCMCSCELHP